MEFSRRLYRDPHILVAIAQISTGWDDDTLKKVCAIMVPRFQPLYGPAVQRTQFEIAIDGDAETPKPELKTRFAGVEIKLDDRGSVLWLGFEGIVARLVAPYPGRDALFSYMDTAVGLLLEEGFDSQANRVSIAIKSNINPPGETFQVEDYIVPRFDFESPDLSFFNTLRHDITVNLDLWAESLIAKIVIESATEGRSGLDLLIDVLDHRTCSMAEALERLRFVKDAESRVFEATITESTRELNGVY